MQILSPPDFGHGEGLPIDFLAAAIAEGHVFPIHRLAAPGADGKAVVIGPHADFPTVRNNRNLAGHTQTVGYTVTICV